MGPAFVKYLITQNNTHQYTIPTYSGKGHVAQTSRKPTIAKTHNPLGEMTSTSKVLFGGLFFFWGVSRSVALLVLSPQCFSECFFHILSVFHFIAFHYYSLRNP